MPQYILMGLDGLLESAQASRTRALHDLHRYRSDLAPRAQTADKKIVDAEFRTLAPREDDEPRLKTYGP